MNTVGKILHKVEREWDWLSYILSSPQDFIADPVTHCSAHKCFLLHLGIDILNRISQTSLLQPTSLFNFWKPGYLPQGHPSSLLLAESRPMQNPASVCFRPRVCLRVTSASQNRQFVTFSLFCLSPGSPCFSAHQPEKPGQAPCPSLLHCQITVRSL